MPRVVRLPCKVRRPPLTVSSIFVAASPGPNVYTCYGLCCQQPTGGATWAHVVDSPHVAPRSSPRDPTTTEPRVTYPIPNCEWGTAWDSGPYPPPESTLPVKRSHDSLHSASWRYLSRI